MSTPAAVPFQVGFDFSHIVPVPADPAQTVYVEAGPVRIGVEYRELDAGTTFQTQGADGTLVTETLAFADRGYSLHVFDSATGLEHLRFDAFDDEPHYHYMIPGESNTLVAWDIAAQGDMFPWALEALQTRMGSMLRKAGLPELASAVGDGISAEAFDQVLTIVKGAEPASV